MDDNQNPADKNSRQRKTKTGSGTSGIMPEHIDKTEVHSMKRTVSFFFLVTVSVQLLSAHIRINPTESTAGAREKYTMRVPNEKQVTSSKIEGEFPAGLDVYDFEFKPGWTITFKKDDKGKIIGATWVGKIQPYEFVEFGMLAINPKEATNLVWKFTQYYDNGTKEEFTGPVGAKAPLLPAPVVTLKPAATP